MVVVGASVTKIGHTVVGHVQLDVTSIGVVVIDVVGHGSQKEPPQSMPSSSPFFKPSVQFPQSLQFSKNGAACIILIIIVTLAYISDIGQPLVISTKYLPPDMATCIRSSAIALN